MADARQQQQLADDAQQQQHQQQPSLVAGLLSNLEARVAAQMPEHAVEVLDTHRYAPAPAGNDARPNVTAAAAAARDPPIEVTSELVRTLAVLLRAHSAGGVPEAARAAIALVDSPTATPEDVAGARQAWRWLVARSRARPELCKTEGEAAAFEAYLPMVESRANSRARPPPNARDMRGPPAHDEASQGVRRSAKAASGSPPQFGAGRRELTRGRPLFGT